MKIGIIGCSGDVGRGIAKYLLEKKYTVFGVQRHKTEDLLEYDNLTYFIFDINDMEKLKIFVKKCDVIINCIAPAYIYSNKIARIVGETGRIYLDLTDCIASEKLPSSGTYITSCGYIPGISAALPKLIIDKYFDKVDSGIFIQGGSELCSDRALKDVILSSEKSGYIDAYYQDGKINRLILDSRKKIALPVMGDEVLLKPFLSHEMIDFAKRNDICSLKWFNAYEDISQFTFFLRLVTALSLGDSKKIDSLIMSERKKRRESGKEPYSVMMGDIWGSKNDIKKVVRFIMSFRDMNKLCFIAAACIADEILKSKIEPGVYFGYQFLKGEVIGEIEEYIRESGFLNISEIPIESSFDYLFYHSCEMNLSK